MGRTGSRQARAGRMRGLRKLLKETAPCKLVGSGVRKRFEMILKGGGRGETMRGLTKRLQKKVFSAGSLPSIATENTVRRAGGHWRGRDGGRRRGSAVDAQVSRLAGLSAEKRAQSKMLLLTRLFFTALSEHGLEPVMGQRAVCSLRHKIGTACDVVCHDASTRRLVIVELKAGFTGSRLAAATEAGQTCKMRGSLAPACDCIYHRHMAQLAATHALFTRESATLRRLQEMGVERVDGLLCYVCDRQVELFPLPGWWSKRASAILDLSR